jgi:glycosyltransferase involved in cell wall biosynthesis
MPKPRSKEPLLTVIVPFYNEEQSIPEVVPALVEFCRGHNWKVLFVDDGSTDGTPSLLAEYENMPDVRVVRHKLNRGYGGALKTGILESDTPYAVTVDGDGQHDPQDVEKIFAFALERDADMVVGWRDRPQNVSWYRELGKSIIRGFTRLLMPLPIHDLNSGFKLYRTELAKRYVPLCPDSMAFSDIITLIFINQRNLVLETPITIQQRRAGQSTINTYTAVETVMEIINLALMFNPLRVFLPLSAVCILVGLGWGVPFLVMSRGVSVGSMLAIVTGLLFFVIGLIASQLAALRMGMLNRDQ